MTEATSSNKILTEIGPCGISCTICRFKINEQCQCRIEQGPNKSDKARRSRCPVLQCAITKDISFCARDCRDFPCPRLENTIPFRWSRADTQRLTRVFPNQIDPRTVDTDFKNPTLRIFCLGEFRVFRGLVELNNYHWSCRKGPTHKIKAMLAFLLFQENRGARKETIIDILWPQQNNPYRATSSFHQALYYLRRALEPDLATGSASSYIQRQGERYYFAPQKPCWVDTHLFDFYVHRALAVKQDSNSSDAFVYWKKALDLYRGDFLSGLDIKYTCSEFYDWCTPLCAHYKQLFISAKMAVARYYKLLQQHDLAMEQTREILCVEPGSQQAQNLLASCLDDLLQPD